MSSVYDRQKTLLHLACQDKAHKKVEAYLKAAKQRGINVNHRDEHGRTAFHLAFGYNYGFTSAFLDERVQGQFTIRKFSPIIEVILRYSKDLGINFEVIDDEGKTAMDYLYQARSAGLVKQFLECARNEFGIELDKVNEYTY